MRDTYYVNIYTEGKLPWIKQPGPLFEYPISAGILEIIKRDNRIEFEVLTNREQGRLGKERYFARKNKKNEIKEEPLQQQIIFEEIVDVTDEIVIPEVSTEEKKEELLEPPFEQLSLFKLEKDELVPNELDDSIDSILEERMEELKEIEETGIGSNLKNELKKEAGKKDFQTYKEDDLLEMTKAQMKKILKSRGYESGPYAPKYHDTLEILRRKVLTTQ